MRKLIDLHGKLDEKGTFAHALNVAAAKEGDNLKRFIEKALAEKIRFKGKF